jgi:hypothetical protein
MQEVLEAWRQRELAPAEEAEQLFQTFREFSQGKLRTTEFESNPAMESCTAIAGPNLSAGGILMLTS